MLPKRRLAAPVSARASLTCQRTRSSLGITAKPLRPSGSNW